MKRARRAKRRSSSILRASNLLVDLSDPRFEQGTVHHALEALDARGIRPIRDHRTPEPILSWIDLEFGGVWSSEAAAGGIYIADDPSGPLGFAAFDARGLAFHWLRRWQQKGGVGIFGPFGVVERARATGLGPVLLHAAMFSLRERGYRHALIPVVGDERLVAYYARETGARAVETVDLTRRGRRWRVTVLASGEGTNFQTVVDAARAGEIPLDVTALVVNREAAFVRERASAAGVPAQLVAWQRGDESRETYDSRVLTAVAATEPEIVLLLGWMHVLPPAFLARFPQVVNIHPAFLPLDPALDRITMPDGVVIRAFRGARAVDDALAEDSPWIGATVHRVGVAVDRGQVLARAPLAVTADEDRAALDERLHALERLVLLTAIHRWCWEQPD